VLSADFSLVGNSAWCGEYSVGSGLLPGDVVLDCSGLDVLGEPGSLYGGLGLLFLAYHRGYWAAVMDNRTAEGTGRAFANGRMARLSMFRSIGVEKGH
jgi:hypothetical protein